MSLGTDKPYLSICIATFERAELLRHTMGHIAAQLIDEVELVVVDGASQDHTRAVVESFMSRSGAVRYHRLAAKGGVDNDFRMALEHARGEYVWFFCDDDLFESGAVERVCKTLHAYDPDFVVANGRGWDDETGEVLKDNFLGFSEDRVYPPGHHEALFRDVAAYITYIGAVIVRRALWLDRPHARYSGSELAHIGVIFHKPLPGPAVVIGEPLVRLRLLNNAWTSRSFKIWMFNWPNLVWSLDWLSERTRNAVVPRRPWRNLAKLVVLRASGDYNEGAYQEHIRGREDNVFYRLAAWAVAKIPGRALRVFTLACYRVFLPGRRLRIQQLSRRLSRGV